jgi:hypothetical protein
VTLDTISPPCQFFFLALCCANTTDIAIFSPLIGEKRRIKKKREISEFAECNAAPFTQLRITHLRQYYWLYVACTALPIISEFAY